MLSFVLLILPVHFISQVRVKVPAKDLFHECKTREGDGRFGKVSDGERKRKDDGWTIEVGGRIEVASKLVRSELRFIRRVAPTAGELEWFIL